MFEILSAVVFFALFGWAIKLTFKLAWGITKIIAVLLLVVALPLLIWLLVVGAGIAVLAPVCMLVGAVTILKFFCK